MSSQFDRVRVLSLSATCGEKVFSPHSFLLDVIEKRDHWKAREAVNEHLTK
jgi:DNA-binding FadR family transcriptional regulator